MQEWLKSKILKNLLNIAALIQNRNSAFGRKKMLYKNRDRNHHKDSWLCFVPGGNAFLVQPRSGPHHIKQDFLRVNSPFYLSDLKIINRRKKILYPSAY